MNAKLSKQCILFLFLLAAQAKMTDVQNDGPFKVGDIVYAGRPPLYNFAKDKKQNRAKIVKVLPAARRIPLSYLVSFDLPDAITRETHHVVVPSVRRGRKLVILADDTIEDSRRQVFQQFAGPILAAANSAPPETPSSPRAREVISDDDYDERNDSKPPPLIVAPPPLIDAPPALIDAPPPGYTVGNELVMDTVEMLMQEPSPTPTLETDITPIITMPEPVESTNPIQLVTKAPVSKKRGVHTCSLCGQIRRGHICPKTIIPSCILATGITNTPVFGISIKKFLCRKINRLGASYNRNLVRLSKIMQLVFGAGKKLHLFKTSSTWGWCRGFLPDADAWIVSATLSIQFSHLTNDFGWGVDSSPFWCRPIFFNNNLDTDGKQWVRQVTTVFPVDGERLNWCQQYHVRTRNLIGGPKHNGSKLCYRRPQCTRCGTKTKCFHVLGCKFECKDCVNSLIKQNELVTYRQVLQMFNRLTRVSLQQVPCIRIQAAESSQKSRYYLWSSVMQLDKNLQAKKKKSKNERQPRKSPVFNNQVLFVCACV